jgi:FeS assembly SUF system protein
MSEPSQQVQAFAPLPPGAPVPTPEQLKERVVDVLRTVYDPEIPVNIYELGLVYGIEVSEALSVKIDLTLTSPMCPVAGSLPPEVEWKVKSVPGVTDATVNLVWEPPWDKDRISPEAKALLNIP